MQMKATSYSLYNDFSSQNMNLFSAIEGDMNT